MSQPSPLEVELAEVDERLAARPREHQIIGQMWVYAKDLRRQATEHARAKSWYQSQKSKIVVRARSEGEKSASAAEHLAEADDDIYRAHLAYRLAEQLMVADRAALNVLHAELDMIRTERADARKADEFQARES